jgi:hypothetical protein
MQIGTMSNYLLRKNKIRPKVTNFVYLSEYKSNFN